METNNKPLVREDFNFWMEATNFTKEILPKDIEKRFIDHCKEQGFNKNEMILFRVLVGDAVEFELTMAMLKNKISESEVKSDEKDSKATTTQ